MTSSLQDTFRTYARPAGLAYLVIIVFGITAEMGLRGPLIDWTDAQTTAQAISAHRDLFRLSIGADMVMALCDVVLAVLLYRLLRPVDETLALMAMVFRLMQMAIVSGGILYLFQAEQMLIWEDDLLSVLRRHAAAYDLGLLFFGVNTLITANLLCRSGLFPTWITAPLGVSGLVYIAGSLSRFVAPEINAAMQMAYIVPLFAEAGLCLWLLFAGRRAVQPA
ncbi:MAG: DUF4386 domain-containing protein [Thalassovita sp.]|nr:DUF4386 domain-containing protein [Thalassovita sp.]